MNEIEKVKNELASEMYCSDHYGESCDGDCEGCMRLAQDNLTEFENLVRADAIDLIDRHLWNYSHEVWEDFKPILEKLKEQNNV